MYRGIENLLVEEGLSSPELRALAQIWQERCQAIKETEAYSHFTKRLQREWAIETGIIERLYTWDRGVTEVLIEHGIDAAIISHQGGLTRESAEYAKSLIDDQLSIVEGLFSFVTGQQPLTSHFIRQIQAEFTARQEFTDAVTPAGQTVRLPILRGQYKKHPNNPRRPNGKLHEYCPPEFVTDEMERLLLWYSEAEAGTAPEVLSAWLHHRFTQIHPFQDGNGRVARTLASLVFLKSGLFPLVIRYQDRERYIDVLETADGGSLKPLVILFAKRQRDSILDALGLEQQALHAKRADQIIQATVGVLRGRFVMNTALVGKEVYETAERLQEIAEDRLNDLADPLVEQLGSITPMGQELFHARVSSADDKSEQRHYFRAQIVDIAKRLGYHANVDHYRAWVRLSISTEKKFELVFSFHGFGRGETGVMAVSAFTAVRAQREDGGTDAVDTMPASFDFFQFNYLEDTKNTEKRFRPWLEDAVVIGLTEWRRQVGG
ncbi:MAG: Fic family protein [Pseudomonadota bacterium]